MNVLDYLIIFRAVCSIFGFASVSNIAGVSAMGHSLQRWGIYHQTVPAGLGFYQRSAGLKVKVPALGSDTQWWLQLIGALYYESCLLEIDEHF